jgi:hypothetical protein
VGNAGEERMSEAGQRMVDESRQPDAASVAKWMGRDNYSRWTHLTEFIGSNYPGVFTPEWLFGGKKHGWRLRFKKSKSFCSLIPERDRMVVLIVLGGKEREETEKILPELSPGIRKMYAEATTYHDGKWLAILADRDQILDDIKRLLAIKRKPKRTGGRQSEHRQE